MYLPGKMGIFMGYVSLPEGTSKFKKKERQMLFLQWYFSW